jgi:predicted glycosyltransferase
MKILMYSHDSYGLGHLRRTLALAEAFVERDPEANVLLLTGSTISGAYRMSQGIDLLKLPSAVKVGNGVYEPSRMSVSFEELRRLRSQLIKSAAVSFEPDVFIVDKAPLGMKSEVEETLRFLREERARTLTVLGLRDVMDDPDRVRKSWEDKKIPAAIEDLYDLVLVYGPREIYDPLPEYGLPEETLDRTHYVGYIGKRANLQDVRDLPFEPGYVLVTAGGGGDGFELVKSYLKGIRLAEPGFDSIIVTGPLMADEEKREVEQLARGLKRVQVLEFRPDMETLIQGAGAVVAMGGYNTTTELLASRKPTLIVPRVEPRVEQLIRAERLADLGLIDMIHPDDLTPGLIRVKVEDLLESSSDARVRVRVDFSGAERAVELVRSGMRLKRRMRATA